MRNYLIAFAMTQSMFCSLPFRVNVWKEEARKNMLLFLPLIGLEIGALWLLSDFLMRKLGVPTPIYSLVMSSVPYLTTGFIHLDGFLDVSDAIGSWRDLEKKREILKDSHVGSFAVIRCVLLFLAEYAVFSSLYGVDLRVLIFIPIVSRCCSAVAVTILKPMHTSQYAQGAKAPLAHTVIEIVIAAGCVIAGFLLFGIFGFAPLAAIVAYLIELFLKYRSLEGMNGDISGYCITVSEFFGAAACVVCAMIKVSGLL